ncbi:MAG: glycogen/starch/alpha-glucan phosphorylase [Polyangiaceae bacterium]|nr:glycogen/starch/alpha-glucan phosphorylase [Polyangiaceae bacterium]
MGPRAPGPNAAFGAVGVEALEDRQGVPVGRSRGCTPPRCWRRCRRSTDRRPTHLTSAPAPSPGRRSRESTATVADRRIPTHPPGAGASPAARVDGVLRAAGAASRLKAVLDWLRSGHFEPDWEIGSVVASLLEGGDPFMVLAGDEVYVEAQEEVDRTLGEPKLWAKMAIHDTARIGEFSSDRTIRENAAQTWHLERVDPPGNIFPRPGDLDER